MENVKLVFLLFSVLSLLLIFSSSVDDIIDGSADENEDNIEI
jgi:hypothetical protein